MTLLVSIEYWTGWGERIVLKSGARKFPLQYSDNGMWTGKIELSEDLCPEYHYELERDGLLLRREWGSRKFPEDADKVSVTRRDYWIDVPANLPLRADIFKSGPSRRAGTAIPVFSLRSKDDFGVGEFLDLKKMIDWAAATGQSVIQLLPINDTTMTGTWQDSYPYNANSTFALHPQFVNLKAAGAKLGKEDKALQKELNALPQMDYERVNEAKDRILREAYELTGEKVEASAAYRKFYEANEHWLLPYAMFRVLTAKNKTADFSKWKTYAVYDPKKAASYCARHKKEVGFHIFVQFHLDKQLSEVCRYAHSKGVILKGDLPIGISRTSVDAWVHPDLFYLDSQAGAPPDAFSADGQNWGLPTYNWDRMEEDNFAWWKARLKKMAEYFDAFRIDHILGFFRIWEIPIQYKSGLMGHFNPALPYFADELRAAGFDPEEYGKKAPAATVPGASATAGDDDTDCLFLEDPRHPGWYHIRIAAQFTSKYNSLPDWKKDRFNAMYNDFFYHRHNAFWKASALRKLPELTSTTSMITCGEDLGMIPGSVPETMRELQILSLEIQRMPKSVEETFADPAHYPYFSVCTTSTHDMNPIRAWWEEDRNLSQRFYNEMLGCEGEAPYFCEPWVCQKIVRQHLESPSMFTILPLQDWLAMDGQLRAENPGSERINVPAIPRYYWRYRMHIPLETLLEADGFNTLVREMVSASGR